MQNDNRSRIAGGNALAEGSPVCRGKATILIVEDDVLARMSAGDELRQHGYWVIEAASADEALPVLNGPTRIDVVVTDMSMPGALDGAGLARHIHAALPFIKVVMISGQNPEADLHELLDGYLPKPIAPTDLASYVLKLTS